MYRKGYGILILWVRVSQMYCCPGGTPKKKKVENRCMRAKRVRVTTSMCETLRQIWKLKKANFKWPPPKKTDLFNVDQNSNFLSSVFWFNLFPSVLPFTFW